MKKKLLVVGLSLYNGGAEKSLVNFLNLVDFTSYDVDLLLFRKEGLFLNQIPEQVNILDAPTSLKYCYVKPDVSCLKSLEALKTVIWRIVSNMTLSFRKLDRYEKRQIRWNKYYGKAIKQLDSTYDVAIAYFHGEVSWYVIDKVTASKKILWVHNDYSEFKSNVELELPYFAKADTAVSISENALRY